MKQAHGEIGPDDIQLKVCSHLSAIPDQSHVVNYQYLAMVKWT